MILGVVRIKVKIIYIDDIYNIRNIYINSIYKLNL